MNISIRALTPDDWQLLKAMRLLALQTDPGVFSVSYDDESEKAMDYWLETLNGKGKCVFGLFDGERHIGITAGFTLREDVKGETGVMAFSYILPEYRGLGLSRHFYEARIAWALEYKPWKTLSISHRQSNEASKHAMISHGFKFTDKKMTRWPDGKDELKYNYEMNLVKVRG
jgi:GNAT superfamily N-acetyltransferase